MVDEKETRVYLLRSIPEELWQKVRERAERQGVSIRVWIMYAMMNELERPLWVKKKEDEGDVI